MEADAGPGVRVLTWRWLLVAAAAGLLVLSLGQAILRGDREALGLAVVIVVGLVLLGNSSESCCRVSARRRTAVGERLRVRDQLP